MSKYKDFMGNELKVGDFVVSSGMSFDGVMLNLYKIIKFTPTQIRIKPIDLLDVESTVYERIDFCRLASRCCKVREEDVTMYILSKGQVGSIQ